MEAEIDPKTGERRFSPQTAPAAITAREYVKGLSLAQLEDIALEVLSEALQTVSPKNEPELAMKLANATLDRTRGKPVQSMQVDQNLKVVTVNASISFVQPVRDRLLSDPVDNMQVIENVTQK